METFYFCVTRLLYDNLYRMPDLPVGRASDMQAESRRFEPRSRLAVLLNPTATGTYFGAGFISICLLAKWHRVYVWVPANILQSLV